MNLLARVILVCCTVLCASAMHGQFNTMFYALHFETHPDSASFSQTIRDGGVTGHVAYFKSRAVILVESHNAISALQTLPGVRFVSAFYISEKGSMATYTGYVFARTISGVSDDTLVIEASRAGLKYVGTNPYLPQLLKFEVEWPGEDVEAAAKALSATGLFSFVVADMMYTVSDCSLVNDTHFARQWSLKNEGTPLQGNGTPGADINIEAAWEMTTGSPEIKIAILDSGVDTLHPDLTNKLLPGFDAMDDITHGYPTPNFSSDGHGTACAGIAAAETDNSEGIAGVCPECRIVPVKVFAYENLFGQILPFSDGESFVNGISWQWQVVNADVSSNSWGVPDDLLALFPGQDLLVNEAIEVATTQGRDGLGLIMIFSSGNSGDTDTEPIWPARHPATFAVNATSMCDESKTTSSCDNENWAGNWGPGLDVSAPGVRISTTDMVGSNGYSLGNYTHTFNGTSAACPIVAGIAGLALSINPVLERESLQSAIRMGCDKVGGYDYGWSTSDGTWSEETGHGRVNAYKTLLHAKASGIDELKSIDFVHRTFPDRHEVQVLDGAATFALFAADGRLVQRFPERDSATIPFSQHEAGFYLLIVNADSRLQTIKLVIP